MKSDDGKTVMSKTRKPCEEKRNPEMAALLKNMFDAKNQTQSILDIARFQK
jgi:hypothetical protein